MILRRESAVALLQVGMEFPPITGNDRPAILCAFSQVFRSVASRHVRRDCISTLSIFITKCFPLVNRPIRMPLQDSELLEWHKFLVARDAVLSIWIRCEIHPKSVETTPCGLSSYVQQLCELPGIVANEMSEQHGWGSGELDFNKPLFVFAGRCSSIALVNPGGIYGH